MKEKKRKFSLLIFTGSKEDPVSQALVSRIGQAVPGENLTVSYTIQDLSKRCCRLPRQIDIVVLMASSRSELDLLCNLSEMLEKSKVILILPDRHRATLSMAWLLQPVYIDFSDTNFSDTIAVILNIFRKDQNR